MDCLWNVCGLLGMDFSVSLIGFPQPFVCVWAGHASHGCLRDGRALLALIGRLYTGYSILSGICLTFCASSCKGRNTTARNSNFPEQTVDEKAGDVIYWAIIRQMYHARDGLPGVSMSVRFVSLRLAHRSL